MCRLNLYSINVQVKEITDPIPKNVGVVEQSNCIVAPISCGRGNASHTVTAIGKPDVEHTRAGRETLLTLAISVSISDSHAKM